MDLRKLDLNLLVVLDVLLDERSVSRAARRLALSQPAVSAALARLRHQFGDQLLLRGRGEMFLSVRAAALREPLKDALQGMRQALEAKSSVQPAEIDSRFRLVMTDYPSFVLSPLIAHMRREAPRASLDILPLERPRVFEWLREGRADAALIVPLGEPAGIVSMPIFRDDFILVCNPDHELRAAPSPSWEDIMAYPLVDFSFGGELMRPAFERLRAIDPAWKARVTVPQFLMMLPILENSPFIAVMGRVAAASILPTPERLPGYAFSLAWHSRMSGPPEQVWFRSVLFRAASDLVHEVSDG
jgi:DNA-binding transcriptional LysR family regulator